MNELQTLTPRQIVAELDKYIIGQNNAKRSVAIALRNRWRRQRVGDKLREEIMPNNIILIGPTGVGKTEIARRISKLAHAPFIKVEASKFTEVGYVGRDVESMIRDLTDLAVAMVRSEKTATVQEQAEKLANERIVDLLMPSLPQHTRVMNAPTSEAEADEAEKAMEEEALKLEERRQRSRDKMRKKLLDGEMEDKLVEMDVASDGMPMMQVITPIGVEELGINLQDMVGNLFPKKMKRRKMKVSEARPFLTQEEAQKLIDMDQVVKEAVARVENSGIVFLDEIDKIAGVKNTSGPDVSREGVQRDLLPVVEGTNVFTKYGMVKTDHVLFIASGAFHVSKPSDLIPELQGRFPIRVELQSLTAEDFVRILTEPENALLKQYLAMLETEGIELVFEKDAIAEVANIASRVNEKMENIGARRLHTVLTALLEDVLFHVPDQLDSLGKPAARGDKAHETKEREEKTDKKPEEQTDKKAREKLADNCLIIERLDKKQPKKAGKTNASDELIEEPSNKDAPTQPDGQEAATKKSVAKITITARFVKATLDSIVKDEDLSRYIL